MFQSYSFIKNLRLVLGKYDLCRLMECNRGRLCKFKMLKIYIREQLLLNFIEKKLDV